VVLDTIPQKSAITAHLCFIESKKLAFINFFLLDQKRNKKKSSLALTRRSN